MLGTPKTSRCKSLETSFGLQHTQIAQNIWLPIEKIKKKFHKKSNA